MPDFGAPVAQNVTGPNIQTLSDIMGFKQKQLALQQAQDTYGANVARTQADSSLAQTNASVAQQTAAPKVAQQVAQTGLDQFKLTGAQAAQSMQLASGLISDPDFMKGNGPGMVDKLNGAQDTMVKQFGVDPKIADATITTLKYQALHNPQQVRQSLINMTQQQRDGAGQQAAALPAPQMVNNGQTVQPQTQGNPALTGVAPGTPVGGSTQLQPPPTTPTVDPKTGQPSLFGVRQLTSASPPVSTGTAPGVAEGITGPVAANNAHYATVQQDAQAAANRIAALQTIKQEAPSAVMGGGDYRRKIVSQLSGLFGIANDAQTSTDVMAKNLAVLAAQGGNTDAARSLGEMANPSYHMTADAAKTAADQLIGIEAKKQAAAQFFSGTPTNSPDYAQKMSQWNHVADPRAFEYAAKSPADQATMKAQLVKAGTWSQLANNMRALHAMGVDPQ